ncbi:MAG TPA: hypothetical protein VG099_32635 [Gemmataceae bacterium]|nr:hypothetical protein [Gemmataceae bacterium]
MQSRAWIKLLQRIPPDRHDGLVLMTVTGNEISIQTIFRQEEDFLVLRGRMSGTTDDGRIFFIPYDQITYLGIVKAMRETEVHALLGGAPALAPSVQRILDTPSPTQTAAETAPTPVPPEPVAAEPSPVPGKPAERLAIPRRSGLIARLRARTNTGDTSQPAPRT